MESAIILLLILVIIISLTCLCYKNEKNKYQKILREGFICKNPTFRKNQKINYIQPKQIYKEDDDINYHIENPIKEKVKKPFEMLGWRNFFKNTYSKSMVKDDTNFHGTIFRNYLDNLTFLHN